MSKYREFSTFPDYMNGLIFSSLKVPKELLTGDSTDYAKVMDESMSAWLLGWKNKELFKSNNGAVLKGRVRRHREMIAKLEVNEEGLTYILGRISAGMNKVGVEIAENFVGDPYYNFTLDGKDLFDGFS